MEQPPLRWDSQMTIPIRPIFIGQMMGLDLNMCSPMHSLEQVAFLYYHFFTSSRRPDVVTSPLLNSMVGAGAGHPGANGLQGTFFSSLHTDQKGQVWPGDQVMYTNQTPKVTHTASVSQIMYFCLLAYMQVWVVGYSGQITENSIHTTTKNQFMRK